MRLPAATVTLPLIAGTNWAVTGAGAFKVQVSTDNGTSWNAQEFCSSDRKGAAFQEDYKLIPSHNTQVRVRFISTNGKLRNLRVRGDYRVWSARQNAASVPVAVEWRGHRLQNRTASVTLKYDVVLPGGARAAIEETPEIAAGGGTPPGLQRQFSVSGLPAGTVLSLKLNRLEGSGNETWQILSGSGTLQVASGQTYLQLAANDVTVIRGNW